MDVFWFRRDLRSTDNAGLYHALKKGSNVQPIFIFDQNILDDLEDKADARVSFLHETITKLNEDFLKLGSSLWVFYGKPIEVWRALIKSNSISNVFVNRDYESYALDRDKEIQALLDTENISFKTFKDHVLFEGHEVLKSDGNPYTVFTPYKRRWLARLESKKWGEELYYLKSYPVKNYLTSLNASSGQSIPSLTSMGFSKSEIEIPSTIVEQKRIKEYEAKRNFPAQDATTRLGIHFRFGTISIREKARKSLKLSETFLSEIIWRDFYSQILQHFPHVETNAFRAKYERVEWRNNEDEFKLWCQGKTGYPMVDAGMRELNATGHMHNRVRMIVASFLTKHLLIDWRWGEAYFAQKLLDFDLASNNGGWQWAAGCGTDAAPYFRIFNPASQMEKFDKEKRYIKKWIPEYGTASYVTPMVDHKEARERCLSTYKMALNQES